MENSETSDQNGPTRAVYLSGMLYTYALRAECCVHLEQLDTAVHWASSFLTLAQSADLRLCSNGCWVMMAKVMDIFLLTREYDRYRQMLTVLENMALVFPSIQPSVKQYWTKLYEVVPQTPRDHSAPTSDPGSSHSSYQTPTEAGTTSTSVYTDLLSEATTTWPVESGSSWQEEATAYASTPLEFIPVRALQLPNERVENLPNPTHASTSQGAASDFAQAQTFAPEQPHPTYLPPRALSYHHPHSMNQQYRPSGPMADINSEARNILTTMMTQPHIASITSPATSTSPSPSPSNSYTSSTVYRTPQYIGQGKEVVIPEVTSHKVQRATSAIGSIGVPRDWIESASSLVSMIETRQGLLSEQHEIGGKG
jgi:hypothetical protein